MKTNCMSQMKPNLQKALRTHYLDNTEAKRMINATMNIMVRQLICHTVVTAVRPVMLRFKGDLLRKRKHTHPRTYSAATIARPNDCIERLRVDMNTIPFFFVSAARDLQNSIGSATCSIT